MSTEQTKNTIILTIIAISIFTIYNTNGRADKRTTEIASAEQKQIEAIDFFKDIQIEAKSGIVFDASTGEAIFNKNSSEQLPLASITKIMTAIVAKEIYNPENKYLPEEKMEELMIAMLIESNNNAASTIAKLSETSGAMNFIGLMNKKAGELGLKQMIFSNPTGLDVTSAIAGAYGSAEEVANLLLYGYQKYPEVFEQTKYSEIEMGGEKFTNKNILTSKPSSIVAGKTGLTNLAGGNLGLLIKENDKLFAVVVLGSSEQGRFADAEKLMGATTQHAYK